MAERANPERDFYVGYLAAPKRTLRVIAIVSAISAALAVVIAGMLPLAHRDPGDAVWEDGRAQRFTGVVIAKPYAMLHLIESAGSIPAATTLLVVEMGKFGGGRRAMPAEGKVATLTGFLLRRDGRLMIELEPGDEAIAIGAGHANVPAEAALGVVEITGEMVDSKCWLGAMKPGDGRVHRECAMRCISGGIPPMLVSEGPDGSLAYTLVAMSDGSGLSKELLPLVGVPIRIRGELRRIGTQNVLYAGAGDFSSSGTGIRVGSPDVVSSQLP